MPRYGPAVLRALAAYDEALARWEVSPTEEWHRRLMAWDDAAKRLNDFLRLDRVRRAAVPVLPDESERDVSPHRFKAARGMEPL